MSLKTDLKKISAAELLGIMGMIGKALAASASFADGASPQEIGRVLMLLDDARNALRRALES